MLSFIRYLINKIKIPVKPISKEKFLSLTENAKVLAMCQRHNRPKVFLNDQNQIIKITRPRRFVEIHHLLSKHDIKTVNLEGVYRCRELDFSVVIYECMSGLSLREYVRLHGGDIINRFIHYLNHLHHKKLYFRDGHIGNYLIRDDGDIALIDINSIKRGIDLKKRVQNLVMIMNHEEDESFFAQYGKDKLVAEYLEHSNLSHQEKISFKTLYQELATEN